MLGSLKMRLDLMKELRSLCRRLEKEESNNITISEVKLLTGIAIFNILFSVHRSHK
jgi:hypothetical protein